MQGRHFSLILLLFTLLFGIQGTSAVFAAQNTPVLSSPTPAEIYSIRLKFEPRGPILPHHCQGHQHDSGCCIEDTEKTREEQEEQFVFNSLLVNYTVAPEWVHVWPLVSSVPVSLLRPTPIYLLLGVLRI